MNNRPELISILMAAYNAGSTIEAAVSSVIAQTYGSWELIIVDDASADQSYDLISAFAQKDERITVIRNEVNRGVSFTRKRALSNARGNWIAILDSDDIWASDKLEKQVSVLDDAGPELVFTGSAFIRNDGSPIDWILHVPNKVTYRQLLKQNLISNSSVLVKRGSYEKNYSECDDIHEDFATWLKILKTGGSAYGIDEPLLKYRLSPSSKSGNKLRSAKMNWKTYRYIGLDPFQSFYYMIWYTVNGILKYRHLI